jgi:hypothetical protein
MQGHVARKRDRYYAVIYEGLDPVTGKERRSWHPAGTDRGEAEALATRLARRACRRSQSVCSAPRWEEQVDRQQSNWATWGGGGEYDEV